VSFIRLLLPAALAAACARQSAAPPRPDPAAVTRDAALIVLPLADSAAAWARAGLAFHWRIVAGSAILSLDVPARSPGQPLGAALQAAAPTRCEPGYILVCGRRLAGGARLKGGELTLTIRDSALVAALRRQAPAVVSRSVWQGTRPVVADSVPLTVLP
jgi:hypothetical protein